MLGLKRNDPTDRSAQTSGAGGGSFSGLHNRADAGSLNTHARAGWPCQKFRPEPPNKGSRARRRSHLSPWWYSPDVEDVGEELLRQSVDRGEYSSQRFPKPYSSRRTDLQTCCVSSTVPVALFGSGDPVRDTARWDCFGRGLANTRGKFSREHNGAQSFCVREPPATSPLTRCSAFVAPPSRLAADDGRAHRR